MVLILSILSTFFRLFRAKDLVTLDFEALVEQCCRGNNAARQELMARYEPVVWRAVIGRLSHIAQQDQEEVVANTFIALLKENGALLRRYDRALGLSPESYIRRQALLQCSTRRRTLGADKRRHEVPLQPIDDDGNVRDVIPDPTLNVEHRLVEASHWQELLTLFKSTLSPALMLAFELIFIRELELEEVARTLGCSMDVVYQRKKRLVEALEKAVAQFEGTEVAGANVRAHS